MRQSMSLSPSTLVYREGVKGGVREDFEDDLTSFAENGGEGFGVFF